MAFLVGVKWYHSGFDLPLPNPSDVEHLLHTFSNRLYISFEEMFIKIL